MIRRLTLHADYCVRPIRVRRGSRGRMFRSEFKAETIALIRTSSKSVAQVCRDLDLSESAVHRWLAQAEIDAGRRDGLTTAERHELAQLRRENRVLREERDIL